MQGGLRNVCDAIFDIACKNYPLVNFITFSSCLLDKYVAQVRFSLKAKVFFCFMKLIAVIVLNRFMKILVCCTKDSPLYCKPNST